MTKQKLQRQLSLSDEVLNYLETKEGRSLLQRAGGFVSFVEPETNAVMWAAPGACYWSPRDEDVAMFHQHIGSLTGRIAHA
jgi:hypothetical protein